MFALENNPIILQRSALATQTGALVLHVLLRLSRTDLHVSSRCPHDALVRALASAFPFRLVDCSNDTAYETDSTLLRMQDARPRFCDFCFKISCCTVAVRVSCPGSPALDIAAAGALCRIHVHYSMQLSITPRTIPSAITVWKNSRCPGNERGVTK